MQLAVELEELGTQIIEASSFLEHAERELSQRIIGQRDVIRRVFIAMLVNGHILLEGVPGLAKTLIVSTFAAAMNLKFQRIQFTPDMLPADLVGTMIYNPKEMEFYHRKGPVFANVILADEINRSPAKVQSALLEAMQERQITIGETTYKLEEPFLVLATENPIEQEGTYPLPEAQIDRFMMKVLIDYPTLEEEKLIIRENLAKEFPVTHAVIKIDDIIRARNVVREVYMDEKIENYILNIVFATRYPAKYGLSKFAGLISYGASPRASINLSLAAKAFAFIKRRGYVIPEDVRAICPDVMRHRIGLTYEAEAENINQDQIISEILNVVEVP